METLTLDNDVKVFCVTATSFPEGITEAHNTLHTLVPFSPERRYYGISRPENGQIVYRAAAEEINRESEKFNFETLVLKRGRYLCLTINDYIRDLQRIGHAFQKLLSHPGLDPDGYCVEWYLNGKDVKCMIRLDEDA